MAPPTPSFQPAIPELSPRACSALLAAIVLVAMVLRVGGAWVLKHPLDSDPLAYFSMAQGLAERGELARSEEHTSELQSLMRISYAVFCLKKKKTNTKHQKNNNTL